MTTNPTPGTWTQGSNYEVVASDGTNICKVHNDEGQGEANARLISKLPAMLEIVRVAAEYYSATGAPWAKDASAFLARIGETE